VRRSRRRSKIADKPRQLVPLSIAAPLAAASLAYINARLSVESDVRTLQSFGKSFQRARLRESKDRVNLFYTLESWATSPKYADQECLIYEGQQWTYKEVYETVLSYGTYLWQTHGVKPREIVAMVSMDSLVFIFLWFGLWSIGAVSAFINYNLTESPLVHSIKTSTARLIFINEEVRISFSSEVIDQISTSNESKKTELVYFSSQVEEQVLQTPWLRPEDSLRTGTKLADPSVLISTSGTTGFPKAAIVSWDKPNFGAVYAEFFLNLQPSDRFCTVWSPRALLRRRTDS
jgi:acyl-coenzyme A synthetase/AMP-(fatty) acid ligase